jgi:UDP-N-acetylglucosamine 2-epimerase (non-hydrolysing)
MKRQRIFTIVGTRPEAIKLAPVIRRLGEHPRVEHKVILSGQHSELAHSALQTFQIDHDIDLDLMQDNQSLGGLTARALTAFERLYCAQPPDCAVVQGDTTTAFAAALAAFYQGIRVAHVEAGLRTDDPANPFPEEVNRRFIAQLATLHFAPTERARENLLREGVRPEQIFVTGNTGIDALLEIAKRERPLPAPVARARARGWRLLLVTAHRRESFGAPLERICAALRAIVERNRDIAVVYSVHPNPNVAIPVRRLLADTERISLVAAPDYEVFVELMKAADLILTDSGGIQEEAPSLDKPVLVLRTVTERVEAVAAGAAVVVGTDQAQIVDTVEWLLRDDAAYRRMTRVANPYGDGHAAARIVDAITALSVP